MTALDTNVLLRVLLQDDADQAARAEAFVVARCNPDQPGFINRVVLVELVWVLQSGYRYARRDVAAIVENILRTQIFDIENASEAWAALRAYRDGDADFADCLIAATNRAMGHDETGTFDRAAQRLEGFVPV